jgi:hypothetical protein
MPSNSTAQIKDGGDAVTVPRDVLALDEGLTDWCILHAYRGSIAHGMYEPNHEPNSIDDKDTMAFCVPSVEHYYGLSQYGSRGTREIKHGEWDIVIYEARKAVRPAPGRQPQRAVDAVARAELLHRHPARRPAPDQQPERVRRPPRLQAVRRLRQAAALQDGARRLQGLHGRQAQGSSSSSTATTPRTPRT